MNKNNENPEQAPIEAEFNSEQKEQTIPTPEHLEIESGELEAIIKREGELEAQIESSDLPEETKKSFLKRLRDLSKKVSMVISGVLIFGAASSYIEYQSTRYTVKENRNNNGDIVFQHEDPETTRAINILAGTETLSEAEAVQIFKDTLKAEILKISKYELGDNPSIIKANSEEYLRFLETANTEELVDFAVTKLGWYDEQKRYDNASNKEQIISWVIGSTETPPLIKKELYEALWKMEQECGNPEVRIVGEKPQQALEAGRSCYNPETNTIYISTTNYEPAYENFISELAHSKQREDSPISTTLRANLDRLQVFNRMWKASESYRDAYDYELYSTPGTIEHEAHSVIEPELQKRFDALRPNRIIFLEVWQLETDRENLHYLIRHNPKEKQQINILFSEYETDFITLSKELVRQLGEAQNSDLKSQIIAIYEVQCNDLRDKYLEDLGKIVVVDESLKAVG